MKLHSTNYYNTFITVAPDCPAETGIFPPKKEGAPTIAALQFALLHENPYQFTSDDLLFRVHALRKEIPEGEHAEVREIMFSKGQACLRASPLPKKYGWGIHHDSEGKIALYSADSSEYADFLANDQVKKVHAMRSSRK